MTQMLRTIAQEQQKLAREMGKMALANHEMFQKQVNLAMDQTRHSIDMAREVSEKATKAMTEAVLPEKQDEAKA